MFIDISRTLTPHIAVWPGDVAFAKETALAIRDGSPVNLTALTLSAHTGTHVDAPYHFDDKGAVLSELDLAPYWGPAQVVTVSKPEGPLTPADFAHVDLTRAPRLLVRSAASESDPSEFQTRYRLPIA